MSRFRRIVDRLERTRAGERAGRAFARRQARRIRTPDPALRAVLKALVLPTAGEEEAAARIEARRAALESSPTTVSFATDDAAYYADAAARSRDPSPPEVSGGRVTRHVAEVTRTTSKDPAWGRLFLRVVRAAGAARCVELGTSVGMSGAYIGAGLAPGGRLVTIEGLAPVAAVAHETFVETGVQDRVTVVTGRFEERLGAVLDELGTVDLAFIDGHHQHAPTVAYFRRIAAAAAPGALLIFDDISPWHPGMEAAWREIAADPRVTGSVLIGGVAFAVVGGVPGGHHRIPRLVLASQSVAPAAPRREPVTVARR